MSTSFFRTAQAGAARADEAPWPVVGATDRLFAGWMILTGALLVLPGRPSNWAAMGASHAAMVWLILGGPGALALRAAVARVAPRFARFVHGWYPLVLIPLLYSELEPLNIAVHGGRMFDPLIIAIEGAIFGGQPSSEWAAAMPWLPLSEALHAAYLSYYFIMYLPALAIWIRGTRTEFRQAVFTILLGFLTHYVFFIFFPVEGPRYRNPAPGGGIENGALYQLTHRLLESGSSRGAAFPSSHVGASAAVAVATLRVLPRTGVFLAFLTAGVALGAIYGGFHYAIDAVIGAALGAAVAWAAPAAMRRMEAPGRTS